MAISTRRHWCRKLPAQAGPSAGEGPGDTAASPVSRRSSSAVWPPRSGRCDWRASSSGVLAGSAGGRRSRCFDKAANARFRLGGSLDRRRSVAARIARSRSSRGVMGSVQCPAAKAVGEQVWRQAQDRSHQEDSVPPRPAPRTRVIPHVCPPGREIYWKRDLNARRAAPAPPSRSSGEPIQRKVSRRCDSCSSCSRFLAASSSGDCRFQRH